MQQGHKTLNVSVRNRRSAKKFQADIKVSEKLGLKEIAEQWAESSAMKPVLAKTMIGSLEEFILQALSEGKQLDFGLVSFYPRLSGSLSNRDSDPMAEGLYVRGAVKARSALRDGLKDKIDAVNSYSSVRPRLFYVFDCDTNRPDRISEGHKLSATGRDILMDLDDPEEGVWIERRTKRGYERVVKAKILHSDQEKVDFTYDCSLPSRKYLIAIYTRCGRGKDHKVVVCRHEVFI